MKKLFLALGLPMLLISCGGTPEVDTPPTQATVELASSYLEETKYHLPFELTKEMLSEDSAHFSKGLALFQYGVSIANGSREKMTKFYEDANFKDIFLNDIYDAKPTQTSIGYAFAHKRLNKRNVISVSIRGFNYGQEWVDNFDLGLEGDHAGFAARTSEIHAALTSYIASHHLEKGDNTIMLSGFSRGGAIANLLGGRLNDDEALADKAHIFTYTFESPKGAGNPGNYDNIFNIRSSGDFVTCLAPEGYGLHRYGIDIDTYTPNIKKMIAEFDPHIPFPEFSDDWKSFGEDDPSFVAEIIRRLIAYTPSDEDSPAGIQTRADFVNNYQPTIRYALALAFSLRSETLTAIKNAFAEMDVWSKMGLLFDDGIYNFLKPFLDEGGYAYQDEELRGHCANVLNFVKGPGFSLLALLVGEGLMDRFVGQHYPEINYVLLKNY